MGTLARTAVRLCGVAVARAAIVGGGVALATAFAVGSHDVLLSVQPARAESAVVIAGNVEGLAVGGPSRPLVLTLTNSGEAAAQLSTVTVTPKGTPRCPGTYLTAGTWHGTLSVPPGGARTVVVPVRLAAATPVACAGTAWGLAYSAV
jgi:hypothetical protein